MANTFELIASSTVGAGGASSISFSSIPSTYTDLVILHSLRESNTGGLDNVVMALNGSSSSFSFKRLYGTGSASGSQSDTYGFAGIATSASETSNTFSNTSIYIPNYAGSNYKSYSVDSVPESNVTSTLDVLAAGLWSNTAAITSITFTAQSGSNWAQYSTAYLYGVRNA